MKFLKLRIFSLFAAGSIFTGAFLGVVHHEDQKKLEKAIADSQANAQSFKDYRDSMLASEQDQRSQYSKIMSDAASHYVDLMQKQPELLASHEKELAANLPNPETTPVPTPTPSPTPSTSSSSKSSSTKSSKPKSTRKTKSS